MASPFAESYDAAILPHRRNDQPVHEAGQAALSGRASFFDVVAQLQSSGGLQCANEFEFDVLSRKVVEEPSTLAEENWPELDLDCVENARLQAFLRGICAVQHDVAVTGCAAAAVDILSMPAFRAGRPDAGHAHPASTADRLRQIASHLDPRNIFRF